MTGKPAIAALTLADLRAGADARFTDPDGIGLLKPYKRAALLANPLGREGDVTQLIGHIDGRIVGKVDMFAGEIDIDGEAHRGIWGSALGVPEKHRATGIGLMLTMRMQTLAPWFGAFGVSQIAMPLYLSLRWHDLSLPRFVLVRRSRRFLEAFAGSSVVGTALGPVADVAFAGQRAWMRMAAGDAGKRYELETVDRMPDDLAGQFPTFPGAAPHRSPAWLNWLMTTELNDVPSRRKHLHLVRERASGAVAGYVLTKQRHYEEVTQRRVRDVTIASVQDWMSFDPEALPEPQLLALGIGAAMTADPASPVDAVEVNTADPAECAALKRWGLVQMGMLNFVYKPGRGAPLEDPAWQDHARWRLHPAEGDNFWT